MGMKTVQTDRERIDLLGGSAKVAAMLGLPKHIGTQRVNNWKVRGIPSDVKLQYPHIFLTDLLAGGATSAQPAHDRAATSAGA